MRILFWFGVLAVLGSAGMAQNHPQMMWGSEEKVPFQPRHNLHRIFTPERFLEDPDVFPLYAGRRFRPSQGYKDWQPCLGNPVAAEWAAEAAIEYFRENPDALSFPIGMNDSIRFCGCPLCQDLIDYENTFRNRPDASALVFTFANRAAELLEKEFPDKSLTILAYLWAENVPPFEVHPQVMPYLTADRTQWFDEDFQQEDRELMSRWAQAGPEKIGIYDYYYGGSFLIPRMFWTSMEKSLNHAYELGIDIIFTEMGPTYWDLTKEEVLRRKILEPERTVAGLLTEVTRERYGAAGPLLEIFYRWAETYWREGSQLRRQDSSAGLGNPYWIRGFRSGYMAQLFPVDSLPVAEKLFEMAERLAGDGLLSKTEQANLEQVKAQFTFFVQYRRWVEDLWNWAYGTGQSEDRMAAFEEIVANALALSAKIEKLTSDESREARNLGSGWRLIKDHHLRNLPGRWGDMPLPGKEKYIWETAAWAELAEAFPDSGLAAWEQTRDLPNQLSGVSWSWEEPGDDWQFIMPPGGIKNVSVEGDVLRFGPGGRHHFFTRFAWEGGETGAFYRWGLHMQGRLSRGAIAEVHAHFFDQGGSRTGVRQKGYRSGFSDRIVADWQPFWLSGEIPPETRWVLFSFEVRELAEGDWVKIKDPRLYFSEWEKLGEGD